MPISLSGPAGSVERGKSLLPQTASVLVAGAMRAVRAVARIATRLSRNGGRLVQCLDDLRRHEDAIAAGFERFFPQLADHVRSLRVAPVIAPASAPH